MQVSYNKLMPTIIVIWIAKLADKLSQLTGRGEGGALPGLIAERLKPGILSQFGKQLPKGSILITGTNGKTTTTRMVAAALGDDHGKLLVNRAGSNLTRGLVSYFVKASSWGGKIDAELGVFEVDEAAFPEVFRALKPKAVLVLNLFRDQLDRYGELNTLADKIKSAIDGADTKLILNADDPLVAWLGTDQKQVSYFGMAKAPVSKLDHDFAADSNTCPVCDQTLVYEHIYYAHIGRYQCSVGDFAQPSLNVVGNATKVSLEAAAMTVSSGLATGEIKLQLPGLYNLYNALAAVSLVTQYDVKLVESIQRIEAMPAAFGRAEIVEISGRKLQLLLVKNPTGFNQVIQTYKLGDKQQPLLIVLNDLIADGRDVSWIWDVAFEDLDHQDRIVASGTRSYDLALRLKYAELKSGPQPDLQSAIIEFMSKIPEGQTGLVLPTYTAMLETRKLLRRQTQLGSMNG